MTALLYTETEEDLRATVRKVLTGRSPWQAVLARIDGGEPYDAGLWHTLAAEIGCAGLPVPAGRGGAGAGWREAAVVAEELGRSVAPVPYLGCAQAVAALLACDDTELLRRLSDGDLVATLAVPLSTPLGAAPPAGALSPTVRADGDTLTGTVTSVLDALPADVLIVPAGGSLWQVAAADARITAVTSLDQTRPLADISFDAAPAVRLATGAPAGRAWTAARTAGAVLLAAEQLGIADRCLETTVAYVKQRHQFGRPIGSFQAVKHRLAQLWVQITQARAVARHAAGCLTTGDPDTPVAAHLAQAHCADVAVRAAQDCVQLHGGIGFTWEHPAHLYLKRAKSDAIAFGTPARHRDALAALLHLPGPG
ncbi:acyl-CoA dehydrogenase family protein [Actinoplanes subtropicus]|uniref:acyl-CoA dehydrogenase family protein n=1 Tax=Actinoplanes subtropicus TaxID=543632 RepID=UPI0004C3CFDC|nr:acyl-CoA dehydrogenase family protein [Actinoplanes subtropicus]